MWNLPREWGKPPLAQDRGQSYMPHNQQVKQINSYLHLIHCNNFSEIYVVYIICNIRPNLFVNFVIYCERSHHRICICFLENVILFLENENVLPSPTKEKMPNKVLSSPLRVKSVNSESLGIVCVHLKL